MTQQIKYIIRKKCKADGKTYKPGDEWVLPDDGRNFDSFMRHYVTAVPVATKPRRTRKRASS